MSTIAIIGVTGYAGTNIAREAQSRADTVIGLSRHAPAEPLPGVVTLTGSVADPEIIARLFSSSDVVIVATRATGEPPLLEVIDDLLTAAAEADVRLGVVGGAGSLRVSRDGARLLDSPGFPDAARPEATAHAAVLDRMRSSAAGADWFYVSPGALFGPAQPGERTGSYRTGSDVLLTDPDGRSYISGPDLAVAIIDEVEQASHARTRFTVAY